MRRGLEMVGYRRHWRTSRPLTLLAAVAVLALATTAPGEAAAALVGTMYGADSRPAPGVRVTLTKQTSVGDVVFGLFATAFSLGLACITSSIQICQNNSATATTGPDGHYTFNFKTRTEFGNPAEFALAAALPPAAGELDGPSVNATFKLTSDNGALPDLHLYRPHLAYSGDRRRGHLAFDPLQAAAGSSTGYTFSFADAAGGSIRAISPATPGQELDARLLEDATGSITVTTASSSGGTRLGYRSQAVAFSGTAGAPVSRGHRCGLLAGAAGIPTAETPCRLTDGNLGQAAFAAADVPATSCPVATPQTAPATPHPSPSACVRAQPYIDLGTPGYIGLVVLQGWSGAALESSLDGRSWTSLGRSQDGQRRLPAGTRARYLRADSTEPLAALHEFSAWPGDPPPSVVDVLGGSGGGSGGTLRQVAAPVGAVLLLVLLGLGLAYVLGRRGEARKRA